MNTSTETTSLSPSTISTASDCSYERWATLARKAYEDPPDGLAGAMDRVVEHNDHNSALPEQIASPHVQLVDEHGVGPGLELDEYVLEITDLPDDADDDVDAFADYLRSNLFVDAMKDARDPANFGVRFQGYWEEDAEIETFTSDDPHGALLTWNTKLLEELFLDAVDVTYYALKRAGVETEDLVEALSEEVKDEIWDRVRDTTALARDVAKDLKEDVEDFIASTLNASIEEIKDVLGDASDDLPLVGDLLETLRDVRDALHGLVEALDEVGSGRLDDVRDTIRSLTERLVDLAGSVEDKLTTALELLPGSIKESAEAVKGWLEARIDDLNELVQLESIDTLTDLAPKLLVRTLLKVIPGLGATYPLIDRYSNLSVVCSEYGGNYWIFSPIFSGLRGNLAHPIAGIRKFGVRRNDAGNLEFYTLGVSRMSKYPYPELPRLEILYDTLLHHAHELFTLLAANIWTPLFNELRRAIREKNGDTRHAEKHEPTHRHDLKWGQFETSCLTEDPGIVSLNALDTGFIGSEYRATSALLVGTLRLKEVSYDDVEVEVHYRPDGEASATTREVDADGRIIGREVTGLQPDTAYEFRFEAHWNENDQTVRSEWVGFRTESVQEADPGIETVKAHDTSGFISSNVGQTEAYLVGQVSLRELGFDDVSVVVEYRNGGGTQTEPADSDSNDSSLVGTKVTGLDPGTTYEFRVVVTWDAAGEVERSDWVEIETEPSDAERGIVELKALGPTGFISSNIGETEAYLVATVELDQVDPEDVEYTVEYSSGGAVQTEGADDRDPGLVGTNVTGLSSGTEYKFRYVAHWEDGGQTVQSDWVEFTTDSSEVVGDVEFTIEGPDEVIVRDENPFYAEVDTGEAVEYHWTHGQRRDAVDVYDSEQRTCRVKPLLEEDVGDRIEIFLTVRTQDGEAKTTKSRYVDVVSERSEPYISIRGPSEVEPGEWAAFEAVVPPDIASVWDASHEKGDLTTRRGGNGGPDTPEEAQHFRVKSNTPGEVTVKVDVVNTQMEATRTLTIVGEEPEIVEVDGPERVRVGEEARWTGLVAAAAEPDVESQLRRNGEPVTPDEETKPTVEPVDVDEIDGPAYEVAGGYTVGDPGEYTIRLKVTNDYGLTDVFSRALTVERPTPPSVVGLTGPRSWSANETVEYVAVALADTEPTFEWDVRADGQSSTAAVESTGTVHQAGGDSSDRSTFEQRFQIGSLDPGDYTVHVKVTDPYGGSDSSTQDVTVSEPSGRTDLDLVAFDGPASLEEDDSAEYTARVVSETDVRFEWTVEHEPESGGGEEGSERTVERAVSGEEPETVEDTFPLGPVEPGSYHVQVEVSDQRGDSVTGSMTVTVESTADSGDDSSRHPIVAFFLRLFRKLF